MVVLVTYTISLATTVKPCFITARDSCWHRKTAIKSLNDELTGNLLDIFFIYGVVTCGVFLFLADKTWQYLNLNLVRRHVKKFFIEFMNRGPY